jgi:hypothetical protein
MLQEVLLLLPKHLYASPNPCATYGGIGIARLFVRQLSKIVLILIPYFPHRKRWTGWELNPRPQHMRMLISSTVNGKKKKLVQLPPAPFFLCTVCSAVKWSSGQESLQSFNRFFNPDMSLESMLQQIAKMISITPGAMGQIIKFACLTGLRPAEAVESVRLINDKQEFTKYTIQNAKPWSTLDSHLSF